MDTWGRVIYARFVRMRVRDLLLLVTALTLLVSTSRVLTLCVHDDHVGFEASWQTCCDTASCCTRAAAAETHDVALRTHDGCRDYALSLHVDWVPGDASHSCSTVCAPAIQPPELTPYRLCSWKPLPAAPSRAPPPDRSLRTVILRC